MKAIIVEDKAYIRKALINLLETITHNIDVIGECESVKDAVIVANACKPELVFLDINLTDGTGFDFLEKTKNLNFKVIFITAYEEFALKALKIGAVDYILKPVDVTELQNALDKVALLPLDTQKKQIYTAQKVFKKDDSSTLILSLQDAYQLIELQDLMYCKSDKGYTTFYMQNNKQYLASKPLKEFEQQLLENRFTRPHQSYMVNLNYIDKYDKSGTIFLKNGVKIPVSSRKKDNFLTRLLSK